MKLLDRHITRELLGPFLFGVAAFASLMLAGKELFQITEFLAEYHAPVAKVLKFFLLRLPAIIVMTLPMAMLLSALLGFGRLSGDSEIVALFAGGVSLYRVARPMIVLAILVTVAGFTLNEVVTPRTNSEFERLKRELTNEPLRNAKPFFVPDVQDDNTNALIWVQGGFDAVKGVLRDVTMIRYSKNKPAVMFYGKEAVWLKGNDWQFREGYVQNIGKEQTTILFFSNSQTREVKFNKTPDQLALYQKTADELSFSQLRDFIGMLQDEGADVREYRVRLYQKLSLPLASLIFALIGAPLGLRPQRSSSAMGLGLAIVIIFAYWVLMHYMTILGNNGAVSPAAAAFIPSLLGLGAGVALISRAAK